MLLTVSVFSQLAFAQQTKITDFRVNRKPHDWRFVFESTRAIKYKYYTLENPLRVVFDLQNARLNTSLSPRKYVSTPVTQLRLKHFKSKLQLIFDLDHHVKIKAFTLKPSKPYMHRLVIDFTGKPLGTLNLSWFNKKRTQPKNKSPNTNSLPFTSIKNRNHKIIVVIDPGHGGKDPGATGIHGAHEKNIVLAISKELERDINQKSGFKAVLTRKSDYFIPLRGRLAIARKYKADMFIAIHADAYKNHDAHGVSVFALSQRGATSEAARWIAARENQSELMGGVNLSDKSNMLKSVLLNLSQIATVRTSLQIGQDIVRNIGKFAHLHHGNRVEQAAFVVLKSPDIPSLLVETGFISNRAEERRLINPMYQRRLAKSIASGICQYFKKRPPRGTALAQNLYRHNTSII